MGLEPLNIGNIQNQEGAQSRSPSSPGRGGGSVFKFPPDIEVPQGPPSPSLSVQYSRERSAQERHTQRRNMKLERN